MSIENEQFDPSDLEKCYHALNHDEAPCNLWSIIKDLKQRIETLEQR